MSKNWWELLNPQRIRMAKRKTELIVALDVDTLEQTQKLVDLLSPIGFFKVGSQLFTSCGPAAVRFILARGKKVFLDLKYHDIPNTVASAVRSAVGLSEAVGNKMSKNAQGISMLTVHIQGGREMMEAATKAAGEKAKELGLIKPFIVGISVLTSEQKKEGTQALVLERARLAKSAGLDGVVASLEEAAQIRKELGEDFIIVTPGIRPSGSAVGDQKRVGTPKEAVLAGSNFLIVGRPIIESLNPLETAKKILEEIAD